MRLPDIGAATLVYGEFHTFRSFASGAIASLSDKIYGLLRERYCPEVILSEQYRAVFRAPGDANRRKLDLQGATGVLYRDGIMDIAGTVRRPP